MFLQCLQRCEMADLRQISKIGLRQIVPNELRIQSIKLIEFVDAARSDSPIPRSSASVETSGPGLASPSVN